MFGDTNQEGLFHVKKNWQTLQENPGRGFIFEFQDDQATVVVEAMVDVKNPRTWHNELIFLILFKPENSWCPKNFFKIGLVAVRTLMETTDHLQYFGILWFNLSNPALSTLIWLGTLAPDRPVFVKEQRSKTGSSPKYVLLYDDSLPPNIYV